MPSATHARKVILKPDIVAIARLDAELVAVIQDFRILAPLSWDKDIQREFLTRCREKNYVLPDVAYPKADYGERIRRLRRFIEKTGKDDHPALRFLRDAAESYLLAYYILDGAGTQAVTEHSKTLYGCPDDYLPGYHKRNLEAAKYFLRVAERYRMTIPHEKPVYTDRSFKSALGRAIAKTIDPAKDSVSVVIDDGLTARFAAGPNYVKIRKGATFSEADMLQALHHEALTHTLTFINGRRQPVLKSLGYAAPRTTATQEGLAVFSEYVNMSIELVRMKRIALRILAIDMAESGADLMDLFRFFKGSGQSDEDSYLSAMRIFRGGSPKGGIIFYKDNVYLRGLIEVEAFLKQAMHRGRIRDVGFLFAGKLTTGDVDGLRELEETGYIAPALHMPVWALKSGELAAHLAFNDLTERFKFKQKANERHA
jgi:uncharacterized protein (TIGR02421 family)